MSERKTETISIGGGAQYAKVAARSAAFHQDNEQCSVKTTCEFMDGWVIFTAEVTTKKGTFTGHSLDKIAGRQKQFEKQETIAVGRALAFAGYLASGEIACAEEMDDVVTASQLNSLKLKFFNVHRDRLQDRSRPEQQHEFNDWCRGVIGEDVNYLDLAGWQREWFKMAWEAIASVSAEVPFDA